MSGRAWTTSLLALAAVLTATASPADAKPKRRDARAAFERGLAAYKKHNFEAASESLARSFDLERDADTLFAWAQAQRQLDHCEKAIELYDELLTFDLPAANKAAVDAKRAECRAVVPPKFAALPDDPPVPEPKPAEPPTADPRAAPPASAPRSQPAARGRSRSAERAWYKDPIGLGLLGVGVVTAGVGGGLLLSARSLDNDSSQAFQSNQYDRAESLANKAKSRGNVGVITLGTGGALVIGGVVWTALHRRGKEQGVVTGWVAPGGGGLAVVSAF